MGPLMENRDSGRINRSIQDLIAMIVTIAREQFLDVDQVVTKCITKCAIETRK